MNAFLPLFEPVCTFYQIEIATIFILITLSYVYIKENILQANKKILLDHHVQQMKQQYNILNKHYQELEENIHLTR